MDVAQLVAALRAAGVSRVTLELDAHLTEQVATTDAASTLSAPAAPLSPEELAAVDERHSAALTKAARALAASHDDTWSASGLVPLEAEALMSESERDLAAHLAEQRHNPQSADNAQRRAPT